jgi:Pyruvate/2-oxoacid:ferredoxin oxidoreductase delta subunit
MYSAAKIDVDKCTGCKLCIFACPEPNTIKFLKEAKKVSVEANRCKGCGLCVVTCPKDAMDIGNV